MSEFQGVELKRDHAYLFDHPDVPSMIVRGDTALELECGCRCVWGVRTDNGEFGCYLSPGVGHEDAMRRVTETLQGPPQDAEIGVLFLHAHDEEVGRGEAQDEAAG